MNRTYRPVVAWLDQALACASERSRECQSANSWPNILRSTVRCDRTRSTWWPAPMSGNTAPLAGRPRRMIALHLRVGEPSWDSDLTGPRYRTGGAAPIRSRRGGCSTWRTATSTDFRMSQAGMSSLITDFR